MTSSYPAGTNPDAFADELPAATTYVMPALTELQIAVCSASALPFEHLAFDAVTADFAYSRLLGDRYEIENITKTWDRTVVERTKEIDEWAEVTNVLRKRVPVYTYVNNHFAGHAPDTVRELKKRLLGEESIEPPCELAIEPSGQMSLL